MTAIAPGPQMQLPGLDVRLVVHEAYGALVGGQRGHVGGVERQTNLMARWLTARGRPVGLVTWSEGPPHDRVVDGVRVLKSCCKGKRVAGETNRRLGYR